MAPRVLVNGQADTRVSALDRGLSYGDGLFETIRFMEGRAPLWSRHMARLLLGCERLALTKPDPEILLQEALQVCGGMPDAVVRITLTRGVGERGYAFAPNASLTRIVAGFAAPKLSAETWRDGVRLHVCQTRWSEQPLLAGIKHLNRLEQVLARHEWTDAGLADGVMMDAQDRVVSTVMANLFVMLDGALVTPSIERCGVAGVARAEVLSVRPDAREAELPFMALARASEVFLSSSVRGIVPVQAVGNTVYVPGPVTRALQAHWRGLGYSTEHA
ncbi:MULTISPECIES: aminodeoxychorismate lyase [Dyella]|uniref:Aminodeoxychorismate lyase n=2 Tax=Dyella TaxID=231454 RepID=A0A4R0Z0D9_9GAMM|nr:MULTISPECIES: aminodeoxychorismate lyase [Dyella]TBR39194.1 aminodeoxychorismate lyase [Dyella terrae]TCI13219.1 aminodeoxychorismate lyase [Dyella soli]